MLGFPHSTVLTWAALQTPSHLIMPTASKTSFAPAMTAFSGADVVVSTLAVVWVSGVFNTTSVNVPPTSTASRMSICFFSNSGGP